MDKKTLSYYDNNKESFKKTTQTLDFSKYQDLFISYLGKNSKILDFGCGAGRDTKYFIEKDFDVDAIDGSIEMCKIASEYCGINVKNLLFNEFNEFNKYDGIWACSSILHVPYVELDDIFKSIYNALKNDGIFYASFKYGNFEGYRNDRYFTDLTYEKLLDIPSVNQLFTVLDYFITADVRKNRENEKWLNVIVKKK